MIPGGAKSDTNLSAGKSLKVGTMKHGLEHWAGRNPLLARIFKRLLFIVIWCLFLFWTWFWWAQDTIWFGEKILGDVWWPKSNTKLFDGWEAWYFPLVTSVLLIYFLAAIYVQIPERKPTWQEIEERSKPPQWYGKFFGAVVFPRTFLGTITFGEVFWVCVFVATLLWKLSKGMMSAEKHYDEAETNEHKKLDSLFESFCLYLGWVGSLAYYILLIPVSRGSILLRLTDVPFERAVRYHRWLGHCLMIFIVGHSFGYFIVWGYRGSLWKEMWKWQKVHIAYLPGEISTLFGIALWITSTNWFRRRNYDIFYNLHMIFFVLFSLFAFWHLSDFIVIYALPSLLLWGADRFVRMVQRWQKVSVIATRELSDGTIQVEVLKQSNTFYWPLQHIYVMCPGLSRFGWHPFSVESHPEDNDRSFVFHVKPLGDWSGGLCNQMSGNNSPMPTSQGFTPNRCPIKFMKLEGLYGYTSNYFLKYPVVFLFAGGSGMIPFIPLIKEVLYRYARDEDVDELPKEIILIWVVKQGRELIHLKDLSPSALSPFRKPKIRVEAYVTREEEADSTLLQQGKGMPLQDAAVVLNDDLDGYTPLVDPINKKSWWQEPFVLAAVMLGNVFTQGLFVATIIEPIDKQSYEKFPYWLRSTVYLASTVVSIVLWGGLSIFLCRYINIRSNRKDTDEQAPPATAREISLLARFEARRSMLEFDGQDDVLSTADIIYGSRPRIRDIFESVAESHKGLRICTMASGPQSLNEEVAAGCQSLNGGIRRLTDQDSAYFAYHSVTYTL